MCGVCGRFEALCFFFWGSCRAREKGDECIARRRFTRNHQPFVDLATVTSVSNVKTARESCVSVPVNNAPANVHFNDEFDNVSTVPQPKYAVAVLCSANDDEQAGMVHMRAMRTEDSGRSVVRRLSRSRPTPSYSSSRDDKVTNASIVLKSMPSARGATPPPTTPSASPARASSALP